jgi:integrase/recombinase XerD
MASLHVQRFILQRSPIMTPLRQRMLEDMQIRNFSENTQKSYLMQVSLFARHFRKSPEVLGAEDIRTYQLHLTNEKKLAPGSVLIATAASCRCRRSRRPFRSS